MLGCAAVDGVAAAAGVPGCVPGCAVAGTGVGVGAASVVHGVVLPHTALGVEVALGVEASPSAILGVEAARSAIAGGPSNSGAAAVGIRALAGLLSVVFVSHFSVNFSVRVFFK